MCWKTFSLCRHFSPSPTTTSFPLLSILSAKPGIPRLVIPQLFRVRSSSMLGNISMMAEKPSSPILLELRLRVRTWFTTRQFEQFGKSIPSRISWKKRLNYRKGCIFQHIRKIKIVFQFTLIIYVQKQPLKITTEQSVRPNNIFL